MRVTVVWWEDKHAVCAACYQHVEGAYQIGNTPVYICMDCIETEDLAE